MTDLSSNIILVILVTSFATYLSRFLGVVSSEKMDIRSKIFKWFNCIAYAILAALIARMVVFPSGVLSESPLIIRLLVILFSSFCLGEWSRCRYINEQDNNTNFCKRDS